MKPIDHECKMEAYNHIIGIPYDHLMWTHRLGETPQGIWNEVYNSVWPVRVDSNDLLSVVENL